MPQPVNSAITGPPLRGRALRLILLDELRRRREASVADLVTVVSGYGTDLGCSPSKLVSDSLRWEVRAGRVVKAGWGVYRYHGASRSRLRRASILTEAVRRWAPTQAADAAEPNETAPWTNLGWLWAC